MARCGPQDAPCSGVVRRRSSMSESRRAQGAGDERVQVTRRRAARAPGRRRAAVAAGAVAVLLAGAGVTYATTAVFGQNQVGTEYANGLQVSSDQILKPLGERLITPYGKFMGSHGQPRRPLPGRHHQRPVGVAADLRPVDLPADLAVGTAAGVNQRLHRQHRRPGGPDVLARRHVPVHAARHGHHPVPGQRRRHARRADQDRDPDRRRPAGADRRDGVLARRQDRCTPPSTARTPSSRSTRPPARSRRPGTSASPRAS